jgi:ubiquinone/menaquinone biosynthesis C-methylase UbiE
MSHTFESVNRAFSKQSSHFDEEDKSNPVLSDMRQQIYDHVWQYLRPGDNILELNAGTGIDAFYFSSKGCSVLATDLSDGMIHQIKQKINSHPENKFISCQQLSYDQINLLTEKKFDYVFSNFGGLNCIDDLGKVTRHLPSVLKPGAYITWVIMPPVCLWEISGILKGRFRQAFRRFHKNGVMAHLEGEYFKTYYHSLHDIRNAFGDQFSLVQSEGLGALSPQPHRGDFPSRHPNVYSALRTMDKATRNYFPFNRWADHIVVTFRFKG